MADKEVWRRARPDENDDGFVHQRGEGSIPLVRVPGALLIEDGYNAARDRLIAHAQLLGLNEFDNLAFALAYSEELLRAAIGEG